MFLAAYNVRYKSLSIGPYNIKSHGSGYKGAYSQSNYFAEDSYKILSIHCDPSPLKCIVD